ncbi:MAG: LysR substrate-binding domain-containing protein [Pseudoclavibacter sp.]
MEPSYYANFTLRQLAHFVAAAEQGTLTRAAEQLHLSQSAISASISDLERTLGAELCVRRKGQGMTLTPMGTQVHSQAKLLLASAAEIDYAARSHDGDLVGPLAIGSFLTLSSTVLPPLLAELRKRYPNITVRIIEATQTELNDALAIGELDLAIAYDHDIPSWVDSVPLFSARPYVLLSSDDPLSERETLSMSDLDGPPMVLFDAPPSGKNALSIFTAHGITPNIRYRTHTVELTRSLVARGEGFAMLVHRPVNQVSHEGHVIVERELVPPVTESTVVLAWSSTIAHSPRALAFIDVARHHFDMQPRVSTEHA